MSPPIIDTLPDGPSLSPAETSFQWFARPWAFLDECAATYGDTFTLRFKQFGTHVVVSHPDDVRDVLSGDPEVLHAGRGNALLAPILATTPPFRALRRPIQRHYGISPSPRSKPASSAAPQSLQDQSLARSLCRHRSMRVIAV